jgi:molybdenum cofactor cytidylyltransferase
MRSVGAVILAAGGSSRLGQPKQLLTFRGETLVCRAVRAAAAAGCEPILVVVGENSEAIKLALDIRESRISSFSCLERGTRPRPSPTPANRGPQCIARIIENGEWRRGVGTSIRRGLEQLPNFVEAAVLLACDQPYLDASIVSQLIAALAETGKPIVASSYADTLGVPALFDRSCFDDLLALPDDSGAKSLMAARPNDIAVIPFEKGAIDIDTPADFQRLIAESG